jgi:GNAT superfamily N-acetyltransferase
MIRFMPTGRRRPSRSAPAELVIPSVCELRALVWDDADEVANLQTAARPSLPGSGDVVRSDWSQSSFDLVEDTRAVTCSGALVAYGVVFPGGFPEVTVAAAWHGRGIGTALADFVERRSGEQGETEVRQLIDGADEPSQRFLAQRGYHHEVRYRNFGFFPSRPAPSTPPFRRARGRADDQAIYALLQRAHPEFDMPFENWQAWVRSWGDERFWLLAGDGDALVGAVIGRLFPDNGNIRHLLLHDPDDLELGQQLCLAVASELGEAGASRIVMPVRSDDPAYIESVLALVGAEVAGSLDLLCAVL